LQPAQPFANPYGTVNVPAPVNQSFGKTQLAGLPAKGLSPAKAGGQIANSYSVHKGTETTDDMLAAVGETRNPKGYNDVNYFRGGGSRKAGGGNFPSSKGRRK
jgi:hypothetical protein